MDRCIPCRAELPEGAKHCIECGTAVPEPEYPATGGTVKLAYTVPISSLPNRAVYRRTDGSLWCKLNETYHVACTIENGYVIGAGYVEPFNTQENCYPL